jgi:hypothetical protein
MKTHKRELHNRARKRGNKRRREHGGREHADARIARRAARELKRLGVQPT